jgi:hypothetical protein
MKPLLKFRLSALAIAVFVGLFSAASLVAEVMRPATASRPSRTSKAPSAQAVSAAELASTIAPFRTDLRAGNAVALAAKALRSDQSGTQPADNAAAQKAVKSALRFGPHDSSMWLLLAQLGIQKNPDDPLVTEALKMSYLTGPNRAELIPTRLDVVTLSNALNDADLTDLARSDVRAVLTKYTDQRPTLVKDYVRASATGKKFLEDSVRMLDPAFADSLKDAK